MEVHFLLRKTQTQKYGKEIHGYYETDFVGFNPLPPSTKTFLSGVWGRWSQFLKN